MKSIKTTLMTALVLVVFSCETIDTELLDDPSNLGPDNASIEYLLNATQFQLANSFFNLQFPSAMVSRMELMGVSPFYNTQFTANSANLNNLWTNAYSGFLTNASVIKERAIELETDEANGNNILAVIQIMEAYIMAGLVDFYGDVPYSEANQGSDNFNPGRDSGQDIYDDALSLLNNAIELIDEGGSIPLPTDLYYNGDMDMWKRLAGSLIIKLSVSARHNDSEAVARVNNMINSGNYINSNTGDFQFDFSTVDTNPDSRHPIFSAQYDATASLYLSRDYIERMMKEDFSDPDDPHTPSDPYDPRFNYYFYLQNGTLDFSRRHGDAGPPVASDFNVMPVHGLYPTGGKYNDGTTGATQRSDGAAGEGAYIIMTHAFTQFLIAEAELVMNGNPAGARTALENGITASMNKVTSFRSHAIPSNAPQPSQADINDYIDDALARFDNAPDEAGRLDVIITEYYKALWGNGYEAYNNFRRTGYPSDLPPSIVGNPGVFTHSMWYPAIHVNNNSHPSAVQKESIGQKVWWAEGTNFNLDF